ncbi:caspase family protein [Thermodesulfobacteriota bacterium]
MRKGKRILLCLVISFAWVFGFFPASSVGDDCGSEEDWQSIYILPTNGDHDKNISIDLSVSKKRVNPGDFVTIRFEADKDCYLTLMNVGTSGKITRLWPNDYSGDDNFVEADSSKKFPSSKDRFKYKISGPDGVEKIIAYATSEKDKILDEDEFKSLRKKGFKRFRGTTKDLAVTFAGNSSSADPDLEWGSAQVNLCIGDKQEEQDDEETDSESDDEESSDDGASYEEESSDDRDDGTEELESSKQKGTTYVLAIGVPTGNLKFCHRDAMNFARVMKSRYRGKRLKVKRLLGSDASYDGVERALKWLIRETQPEDSAIVFFSGHGTSVPDVAPKDEKDGRDECFVLYHTGKLPNYKVALKQKKLMRDDDFNKLLKQVPARNKVVIADACHSGTISKGGGPEEGQFVSKYYPLSSPYTGKSMWMRGSKGVATSYGNDHEAIMAACMDNQASYEDPKRASGLFTYHLLRAIKRGARDLKTAFQKARRATLKETKIYARRVRDKRKTQTPILTDPHGLASRFRF